MSKKPKRIPPIGELRQSQVITTFGPGAMLDLPDHSVIVGGLEHWWGDRERIHEARLEGRVADLLHQGNVSLYAPPIDDGEHNVATANISAFQFPSWFLGQVDKTYTAHDGRKYRTRPLVRWAQLRNGKYFDEDRKKQPVVPVRFVRACVKGHLSDIDWYAFVHNKFDSQQVGALWFDEGGAGNDFRDIFIRLAPSAKAHGIRRPLSHATLPDAAILGMCNGRQPWLGPRKHEQCDKRFRLLTRSASNAYFAQKLSVIFNPDLGAAIKDAVGQVYDEYLQYAEGEADVIRECKKPKVQYALEGHTSSAVWAEIQRRQKGGGDGPTKSIKQAEMETLLAASPSSGEDKPNDREYFARTRSPDLIPQGIRDRLQGVVLVHKLREVIAQVGFTRFEASIPDIDGELSLGVELAPLSIEADWVPASENKGEGIFLSFSEQAIGTWLKKPGVKQRQAQLLAGYESWKTRKGADQANFPGLPYIMLHSLSHLLITAVALECGYSASSIRERVYAGSYGYGILLYTGGSGSAGTLGGLVQVGRSIEQHLGRALEMGQLCSNDPVCAQHASDNIFEERFLHGAACHGCLLVAETSCERRNALLDRALVVPTVCTPDAAFFPDVAALYDTLQSARQVMRAAPEPAVETLTLEDLVSGPKPDEGFLLHLEAVQAPDNQGGLFRCEPLTLPLAELRDGSLILVAHPELRRSTEVIGVAAGRWMVREMKDAATGERRHKLFLRGVSPPAELDLSMDDWATFKPLGRLMRVEA